MRERGRETQRMGDEQKITSSEPSEEFSPSHPSLLSSEFIHENESQATERRNGRSVEKSVRSGRDFLLFFFLISVGMNV